MNQTRKALLSMFAALLLTVGLVACSSTADSSTSGVNTAGLGNSTGVYSGDSGMNSTSVADGSADGNTRLGGRAMQQSAPTDNPGTRIAGYSGTGQSQITGGQTAAKTPTTTVTYSQPVTTAEVVTPAPAVDTTIIDNTATLSTTTPDTTTTTTSTDLGSMTSSAQDNTPSTTVDNTATTTTTTTTTHRRMHKE